MKLIVLPLLALTLSTASAQDLPAPNVDAILKELDLIASGAKNQIEARRNAAISQIQAASGSGVAAVTLYLQALDGTIYKETHNDFIEWQRKNGDILRSAPFEAAVQLQLQYLLLALQRSEKNDALAQIPACQAYLETLSSVSTAHHPQHSNTPKTANSEAIDKSYEEADKIIKASLSDSAIVKFYQITDLLPEGKDFTPTPGNYDLILDKNIRGPLRAANDPRLLSTWDQQMNYDAAMVTATGSQQKADQFNQTGLPELLFKKAQDAASIGQPNRALISIIDLIHRYPTNPNVKQWVETARGLASKVVISNPTPAAAPATTNPPVSATSTNRPTHL